MEDGSSFQPKGVEGLPILHQKNGKQLGDSVLSVREMKIGPRLRCSPFEKMELLQTHQVGP